MKTIIVMSILFCYINAYTSEECPHEKAFVDSGWVIHNSNYFDQILQEKLKN